MTLGQLANKRALRPLKYQLREMPHATIETNRTCNIQCRLCYNLSKSQVKPLALIKKEIDLLLAKRNLQVMTILGGEPTLHPNLPEIVAHVKTKHVFCQLLTNGILLEGEEGSRYIDRLVAAGVDKFLLHVDSGQDRVRTDVEAVRRRLFAELEKKKIPFSLSLTIYEGETRILPRIIRESAQYKYFDGILAVMARDALPPITQKPDTGEVYQALSEELEIQPSAYIPSCENDDYLSWLFFFYFIDADTGQVFDISPRLDRVFRKLYRIVQGRQFFILRLNPSKIASLFVLAGLVEIVLNPKRVFRPGRFIRIPLNLKSLRLHYIALQTPPEILRSVEPVHICFHCPDATIRNGRLTPICLADLVNPLEGQSEYPSLREDLAKLAYSHLST
jgi:hypothetical protein